MIISQDDSLIVVVRKGTDETSYARFTWTWEGGSPEPAGSVVYTGSVTEDEVNQLLMNGGAEGTDVPGWLTTIH